MMMNQMMVNSDDDYKSCNGEDDDESGEGDDESDD